MVLLDNEEGHQPRGIGGLPTWWEISHFGCATPCGDLHGCSVRTPAQPHAPREETTAARPTRAALSIARRRTTSPGTNDTRCLPAVTAIREEDREEQAAETSWVTARDTCASPVWDDGQRPPIAAKIPTTYSGLLRSASRSSLKSTRHTRSMNQRAEGSMTPNPRTTSTKYPRVSP